MSAPIRHRGRPAAWAADLGLGIRLAVGGGRTTRTAVARLLLGTLGIGVAVTVLLFAASADHAVSERDARALSSVAAPGAGPGVAPLIVLDSSTSFQGRYIKVRYVHASGPSSPVPPGLSRVPAPGQSVLAPALAELLRSDGGALLRPRFPGPVAGTIGQAGLVNPDDLRAYIGADASLQGKPVYAFGGPATPSGLDPALMTLLLIGIVSLLAPVFVFVATSARVAGAERDRRLAALRLVGSDLPQVRRIAAAEAVVTAAAGLVLGAGAFLLLRRLAPSVRVRDGSLFVSDVTPPWPLVVVVVLVVPALSVLSSLFALRGTAIEPLGVVRRAKPVRRRLWWRVLPIGAGVAALVLVSQEQPSRLSTPAIAGGVTCLLVGVPALLPWLLERGVARWRGGRPAVQLAVRRLQLDSGTPARVVAGIAVVLAGAIAVQSLLVGQARTYEPVRPSRPPTLSLDVTTDAATAGPAAAALARVPGLRPVYLTQQVNLAEEQDPARSLGVTVADCATWRALAGLRNCRDGAVYVDPDRLKALHTGQSYPATAYAEAPAPIGAWTVPELTPAEVPATPGAGDRRYEVMATPGAMAGVDLSRVEAGGSVLTTTADPALAEAAGNALAPFSWHASVYVVSSARLSDSQQSYLTIRAGLLAGSVFTLLLAGVSLLVLGLEQLRERRRTIAVLAATGVPLRVLARSVVWQNAIPLLLGIVTAVATGIVLSALASHLGRVGFTVDWLSVGVLSASAAALVLLVTAMTLPSLRGAARLASMRTE
ncbi:FtsX-like permease family protein [Amycolatopsis sp. PS_44_ISF1]|uniref:ABC transporter permease n=1 Tax=Amycolatopsis sp. PS_44_ISF1 TaxID=2974917 RepID=UPI0028DE878D|nr:FtsX-like permease family protein [Amycolatopsis sp. PS_44_ISF1]MDT8913155.1 ABC transporter permease [Amycolatopsis sp. PS_44_ISF1]